MKEIGQLEGFPPTRRMYFWMTEREEFAAEVARAKKLQAEFFADSAIEVAEDLQGIEPADVTVAAGLGLGEVRA